MQEDYLLLLMNIIKFEVMSFMETDIFYTTTQTFG